MAQPDPAGTTYGLTELPEGSKLRSVTAVPAEVAGRRALRVELTDAVTLKGQPGVDYVDMPTFVIIPGSFTNGTIEVDILSRLNGKGPADARAFAGVAYRVTADADRFEAVYLRPLNGRKANPPSPRDQRAIQYFAYPDWKFDRLREQHPGGLRGGRRHRPRRMDHARARHRPHPADRDRRWNRNPDIERNQGRTRRRRCRPVRRHRQRILLLQPQDHTALSGSPSVARTAGPNWSRRGVAGVGRLKTVRSCRVRVRAAPGWW